MKMNKLSARKDTFFKKPSSSLYKARVATVLKKAFELSELCGVDVCIIWYDREGSLVKTWPENEEAKVRAMSERFSMLSEQERNKKSTNLSGFLNEKMIRDKKASMKANDDKFSQKVSEIKDSLQSCLQTFQESLHDDSSLINVDLDQPPSSCVHVSTTTTTTTSLSHRSKFSILLYNHDNGTFTQSPNFSTLPLPCNQDYGSLLGEQGMRGCNNFILPPPLIQTQPLNFQQFMQTEHAYNHMLS